MSLQKLLQTILTPVITIIVIGALIKAAVPKKYLDKFWGWITKKNRGDKHEGDNRRSDDQTRNRDHEEDHRQFFQR